VPAFCRCIVVQEMPDKIQANRSVLRKLQEVKNFLMICFYYDNAQELLPGKSSSNADVEPITESHTTR
jgi:hypothetical protein